MEQAFHKRPVVGSTPTLDTVTTRFVRTRPRKFCFTRFVLATAPWKVVNSIHRHRIVRRLLVVDARDAYNEVGRQGCFLSRPPFVQSTIGLFRRIRSNINNMNNRFSGKNCGNCGNDKCQGCGEPKK